jgi:hypothetical protein
LIRQHDFARVQEYPLRGDVRANLSDACQSTGVHPYISLTYGDINSWVYTTYATRCAAEHDTVGWKSELFAFLIVLSDHATFLHLKPELAKSASRVDGCQRCRGTAVPEHAITPSHSGPCLLRSMRHDRGTVWTSVAITIEPNDLDHALVVLREIPKLEMLVRKTKRKMV